MDATQGSKCVTTVSPVHVDNSCTVLSLTNLLKVALPPSLLFADESPSEGVSILGRPQ